MMTWPPAAFLVVGLALGHHGLNLLTVRPLEFLEPAISMALATLGAFVGLSIEPRRPRLFALSARGGREALFTIALVGIATLAACLFWLRPDFSMWHVAGLVAVCAAASAATSGEAATIDDAIAVAIGALVLAAVRESVPLKLLWLTGGMIAIAGLVAFAGWLLIRQTSSTSEQRVFAIGSLLLLGGAAAYLSVPALFFGLLGGVVWNAAGDLPRDRILNDLRYVHHPLVVLLLLVAGAQIELSLEVMSLSVIFVTARLMPKGAAAPGIIGIALAFETARAAGTPDWGVVVLSVVAVGAILSELLALAFVVRRESTWPA
jgi:hypothetical protein